MKQVQRGAGARATVVADLRAAFRGLSLGAEQRKLVVQALDIGVVVWLGIINRGLELVVGSGGSMVIAAFTGKGTLSMALIGLVAKMVATLATISAGGSAGLLVPSFFLGTMVALAWALLGLWGTSSWQFPRSLPCAQPAAGPGAIAFVGDRACALARYDAGLGTNATCRRGRQYVKGVEDHD
jgi:H+/Cl- antiporter ClcA